MTLDAGPHATANNIPAALSSFVGRAQELDALAHVLERNRLVTVVGAGGAGKTRLVREVAVRIAAESGYAAAGDLDGVWWVDLAPLVLGADVFAAVGAVLSINPTPGRRFNDAVADALRGQRGLLVLDNCEHVIDDAAALADAILRNTEHIAILCTSREALSIDGEMAWPLPSLGRPATSERPRAIAVAEFDAVKLFVERARAAIPTFALNDANAAAVSAICGRLDGLPLALELAAALVPVLGIEALAARLDDALALLSRGKRSAVPRHRTLRAVLEWSYALLDDEQRTLLRRLSVFRGSFTLDAMEDVCATARTSQDLVLALGRLVEHSLIEVREEDGEARYRLLETVRQFGAALLHESPEEDAVRARHARWVERLSAAAEPALFSPARGRTVERLRHSVDEIRAALTWATGPTGSPMLAVHIAGSLGWFWLSGVPWEEGRTLLARILQVADDEGIPDADRPIGDAIALGRLMYPIEGLAYFAGDTDAIIRASAREASIWARVDAHSPLNDAQRLSAARGRSLGMQLTGLAHAMRGDSSRALAAMNTSMAVAEQSGDPWIASVMTMRRALVHFMIGDHAASQADYEASLPSLRRQGEWWFLSLALEGMAMTTLAIGDATAAARYARESVMVLRTEPDPWFISRSLDTMAYVLLSRHETSIARATDTFTAAARLMGAAESLRQRCGAGVIGPDIERHAEMRSLLQSQLGDSAYMRAFDSGAALSLGDVFALLDDDPVISAFTSGTTAARSIDERLELRVLGAFEMSRNGAAASGDGLPVGKSRELLLFLLLNDRVSKDDIGLALWPDASAAQVRNAFHVTLHHLRRQLGPERWIVFERNSYRLERAPTETCVLDADIDAVLATSTLLRRLVRSRETPSVASLTEARDILLKYPGDLAPGIAGDEWLVSWQDRARAAWTDGMDALAHLLHAVGEFGDAIGVCEVLVSREPLRESAHRLLMESFARRGEPARALAHYDILVAILQRELASRPAAETKALADSLKK